MKGIASLAEILKQTLYSLNREKQALAKYLALPMIAMAIAGTLGIRYMFNNNMYPILLIQGYLYTLVVITTHRIILEHNFSESLISVWKINRRFLRFAGYLLLLALLTSIPALLVALVGVSSKYYELVSAIVYGLIASRFILCFPGIALGCKTTFQDSVEMTRGNAIIMFILAGIFPVVLIYLGFAIGEWIFSSLAVLQLSLAILLVFEVALVSEAYRQMRTQVNGLYEG